MNWRFSNAPISIQFGVLFTLIFLIPIVVLSLFFYLQFNQIQKTNLDDLAYLASLHKEQLEEFFGKQINLANTFYYDREIKSAFLSQNTAAVEQILKSKRTLYPTILSVSFFNADGSLVASTLDSASFRMPSEAALKRAGKSFNFHEIEMVNGRLTGMLLGEYQSGGPFNGFMLAEIDLSRVIELQKVYSDLSQTGELNLVRMDGDRAEIITPTRFENHGEFTHLANTRYVEVRALNKTPARYRDVLDYRGERVFAATEYLPKFDWGLVVKKDRSEVLVPVANLSQVVFFSIFTFLLLLFLIGLYLRRYILFPIQELTRIAKQIQKKTYRGDFIVHSTNEIGALAKAFKSMSEDLISANRSLERKVKQRTVKLRRTLKDVRAQKTRDDALLSSIVEGMVATDKNGKIIRMNAAVRDMLGCDMDANMGIPLNRLLRLRTIQNHALAKARDPVSLVLKSRRVLRRVEYLSKRENGQLFPLQLSASAVVLDGACVGAIFLLRDITKEKEADRMKNEFITITSHQLRTPLASMKWYGELLAKGKAGKLKKDQAIFINRINTSIHRMISLINDFLSTSHLETVESYNKRKRIAVNDFIKELLMSMRPEINEKLLRVDFQNTMNKKTVMSDPGILQEILTNLIGNAIKYSKRKGKVTVRVSNRGKRTRFEIEDTGIGIPKGEQKRLFGKFFRCSNAAKLGFEGTGLGLYTVKRLVERIGGEIGFTSVEGKGSTFWLEI